MADRSEREFSTQAPAPYVGQFLQGGIFPYAQRFLHGQFANMGAPDSSPYTYTGPRVAGFDPRERMGMQMSDQAIGSYSPYLGSQSNLLGQATDYLRKGTGAGTELTGEAARGYRGLGRDFDPSAYKDYMSPYTDEVVDRSMGDIREQMEKQKMGVRDRAVSAGAFGGSRGRLAEGDIERAGLRSMGDISAQLRERGYGQSQQQAFQEFARRQAERGGTAQGIAGLGQQFYGMGAGSAAGLGSLGGQFGGMAPALQNLQTGDINRTMQFGGLGRGRQQSLMDLGYQNFTGQYNLPMQTLQNVGALTASLGPMAGGYGYAGQGMPTEFPGGSAYQPAGGGIGTPGAGSYTPYPTGPGTPTPGLPPIGPPGGGPPRGPGGGPGIPPIYTRGMRPGVGYPGGSASFNEFGRTANLGGGQPQGQPNQYGQDPRAIAANPQGYQNYLQGARTQETNMPGSTFLGQGQRGFEQSQPGGAGNQSGFGRMDFNQPAQGQDYRVDNRMGMPQRPFNPQNFSNIMGMQGQPQGQQQSNLGGGPQTQPLAPVSPTNYNTYGNNMPVGFRYGGGIRSLKYNG